MSDEPAPKPAAAAAPATGAKAGRGALYLTAGNALFTVAGLILQIGLPSLLSRSAFGAYTTIQGIASWINNVMVAGTIQTVSKFTAAEPEKARRVQRAGLRLNVVLAVVIAVGFLAAAPVAAWLLHDPSKTQAIMLAGLIASGYAVYAVFVGTANGLHEFFKQAALSTIFAYVRVALMIGLAAGGFGVIGVIGGWVAAVIFVLVLAIVWVGLPGRDGPVGEAIPVAPMGKFFAFVAVYMFLFNLLMFVDTFLLKRLMDEHFAAHVPELSAALVNALPWATHAGGYHVQPSVLADVQVGYYGAVQNLARLSYQITLSATFVVFPLVSRSTFTADPEQTRRYIGITLRYTLIGAAAIAVVMAANPADVLGLMYPVDFADRGGAALPFLALGNVAFSLIAVAGTVLNSAGKAVTASLVAAGTLLVAIVGNWIAIPLAADSGQALTVAAAVTGGSMVLGAIAYGIVLHRRFGAFVPLLSVLRVAVAIAAAMAVGHFLPLHGKAMTLVKAAAVVVVYLVILVITRELGARDVAAIKAIRAKRSPQGEAT